jgi:hypothetical protein
VGAGNVLSTLAGWLPVAIFSIIVTISAACINDLQQSWKSAQPIPRNGAKSMDRDDLFLLHSDIKEITLIGKETL